jgi:hypothetical protein
MMYRYIWEGPLPISSRSWCQDYLIGLEGSYFCFLTPLAEVPKTSTRKGQDVRGEKPIWKNLSKLKTSWVQADAHGLFSLPLCSVLMCLRTVFFWIWGRCKSFTVSTDWVDCHLGDVRALLIFILKAQLRALRSDAIVLSLFIWKDHWGQVG